MRKSLPRGRQVVISGSFRQDPAGLQRLHKNLTAQGFIILSPKSVRPSREVRGFVFMRGQEKLKPKDLEQAHLKAILKADFVWFFAPRGYVGKTGAFEIGYALAHGIPVFSNERPKDTTLRHFVQKATTPLQVRRLFRQGKIKPPLPGLDGFQEYYRKVCQERGYDTEDAENCLLLLMEEVGELAKALRKRGNLARHGARIHNQPALELPDVLLYTVHMANILGLSLAECVQRKEGINARKFSRKRHKATP